MHATRSACLCAFHQHTGCSTVQHVMLLHDCVACNVAAFHITLLCAICTAARIATPEARCGTYPLLTLISPALLLLLLRHPALQALAPQPCQGPLARPAEGSTSTSSSAPFSHKPESCLHCCYKSLHHPEACTGTVTLSGTSGTTCCHIHTYSWRAPAAASDALSCRHALASPFLSVPLAQHAEGHYPSKQRCD